ncbi:LPXTG cell wall anchor domain-containing protein [Microvirga sp. GCM10011540]|uniref:LPXTG cell wall anchor domain-containing protein n=1 Tax=Microvirga sp. GCM10011540 TaxID=3317338 RepID=UPI003622A2CD
MNQLIASIAFVLMAVSAAWAQAPATPGSPPATDPTEVGQTGGITDYWWIILLVIIVIGAIWYFSRRNRRT